MIEWIVGDRPRVRFQVVDETVDPPVALDPHTVKFIVRPPLGPRVTLVYGAAPEVVRAAAGSYYLDVPLTQSATWTIRAEGVDSAGVLLLARELHVVVRQSDVLP